MIRVVLGEEPADQVIRGGRILNVYTGELLKENVALYQDRIAYVGPSEKMVGSKDIQESLNEIAVIWKKLEGGTLYPGNKFTQ